MLKKNEECRVFKDGKWHEATIIKVNTKSAQVKLKEKCASSITVSFDKIWKSKKRVVHKRTFGGKADSRVATKRIGRHRKLVEVVPTFFHPSRVLGNFGAMLQDSELRSKSFMFFNDNHDQWVFAGLHPTIRQNAGGGNAIARPWEYCGDAIGIPTGPYASLDMIVVVKMKADEPEITCTVKDVIDEAFNRAVRKQLSNPEKTTFYYSADANDPQGVRLGLGIFAGLVGTDVVDLITHKLNTLPQAVQKARVTGIIP
jgi:hypothetical protein